MDMPYFASPRSLLGPADVVVDIVRTNGMRRTAMGGSELTHGHDDFIWILRVRRWPLEPQCKCVCKTLGYTRE